MSAFTEISARKWVPSSGTWLAAHEAKEPHTLVLNGPNGLQLSHALCAKHSTGRLDHTNETFVAGGPIAFDTTQVTGKAKRPCTPAPRRLTPRECERLQGWPDDWTRYGRTLDGEVIELADTPRYRMCGNGVSAPVAAWIARRILAADGPQP